jgi:phage baseplate assembly protein gpV
VSFSAYPERNQVCRSSHNAALRLGIVNDQDPSLGRLRVTFSEFDQMLSYWLPIVVPKTQNDKAYWLPDIGEQVVCLMDERDEAGVVLGAIYSQADATPVQSTDKFHLGFKDGTAVEYDRAAHVLGLTFEDTTVIKYDSGNHLMALNFEDQTAMSYDSAGHALTVQFSDGTAIKYDGAAHSLSMLGSAATSVIINAPAGITLQCDPSYVSVLPGGVTVHPLLP